MQADNFLFRHIEMRCSDKKTIAISEQNQIYFLIFIVDTVLYAYIVLQEYTDLFIRRFDNLLGECLKENLVRPIQQVYHTPPLDNDPVSLGNMSIIGLLSIKVTNAVYCGPSFINMVDLC